MRPEQIKAGRLKAISILYPGDFHDLALWLLRVDEARSTPAAVPRHTLRGVAVCYEYLTGVPLVEIVAHLDALHLSHAATIRHDL
ncbi:MAG TPA: hypothetical protein VHG28_24895 [Longimicrobiaceae bacterium]|nr:hypothetical protein [Longimicrobiaceae bacterium]